MNFGWGEAKFNTLPSRPEPENTSEKGAEPGGGGGRHRDTETGREFADRSAEPLRTSEQLKFSTVVAGSRGKIILVFFTPPESEAENMFSRSRIYTSSKSAFSLPPASPPGPSRRKFSGTRENLLFILQTPFLLRPLKANITKRSAIVWYSRYGNFALLRVNKEHRRRRGRVGDGETRERRGPAQGTVLSAIP